MDLYITYYNLIFSPQQNKMQRTYNYYDHLLMLNVKLILIAIINI